MKKKLERSIENPVVEYARKRGCLVRKLNGLGHAGWPDRMFIGPKGEVFFIEFKRPGGQPTELQTRMMDELHARGVSVAMTDDVLLGRQFVDECIGPEAVEGY